MTEIAEPLDKALPTISIVFLVYNRRVELQESLLKMTRESDYPAHLVDVIVVDNASDDGSSDMVRAQFPEVKLLRRESNCGVSGWNDGFAIASGDYVLALDDDCYLPSDGLRRAVEEATQHKADLVSFGVTSSEVAGHRFDLQYRTGLLAFWGCAVLVRGSVLERLGGYDPEIFVWANEVEFMLRFFDAGYRHLHAPEIEAVHMKELGKRWADYVGTPGYRMNSKNLAYSMGKHLRGRQAAGALAGHLTTHLRDALRGNSSAAGAIPGSVGGFLRGLRNRDPVRPEISLVYRRHFISFASPWWMSRPPHLLLLGVPGAAVRRLLGRRRRAKHPGRQKEYWAEAARYYPVSAATLEF